LRRGRAEALADWRGRRRGREGRCDADARRRRPRIERQTCAGEAAAGRRPALLFVSHDRAFYSGPQDNVRATMARLEKTGAEIDAAYERWAALEALRAG
jgi:hypothetical protein